MCNGTRAASRAGFSANQRSSKNCARETGENLDAGYWPSKWELVSFTPDDIDWEDEVRIRDRGSARRFSSDALTGMEASLRFRRTPRRSNRKYSRGLSAWQNWIFSATQRRVGEKGALKVLWHGDGGPSSIRGECDVDQLFRAYSEQT